MQETVIVLDFGGQYTQLIARRVRELGVKSSIQPCTAKAPTSPMPDVRAVILSGGPASVRAADAPPFDPKWLELGVPVLGICYGMQLLSHLAGAEVAAGMSREYGHAAVQVVDNSDLFAGFDSTESFSVWMSHGDHVQGVPTGFRLLAKSSGAPIAAIADSKRRLYGIQFHCEVIHTPRGRDILKNFIFRIAECKGDWTTANFISESIARIQADVGPKGNVICGLSGGVDSTVAAVLVHRAIGERLHCIFVDNGVLRLHEGEEVERALGNEGLGLPLHRVNAGEEFLAALRGITEPELKRKTIGRVFIDVFEREARRISGVTHLVQGTLYPDVIESQSAWGGPSATIKTHHNVGGLPERMNLKLIEPFRELFKDEVRALGAELDIAPELLWRHPFPGPGLAVRVLGEVSAERVHAARLADAILIDEVRAEGLYSQMWQCFAALLPVRSVGVMGDGRTYDETIAIRAVTSEDGMTADWYPLPTDVLQRVSSRIINEVKGVNRVVLDISSKPPATIEWE